jgi:hypothetical protein
MVAISAHLHRLRVSTLHAQLGRSKSRKTPVCLGQTCDASTTRPVPRRGSELLRECRRLPASEIRFGGGGERLLEGGPEPSPKCRSAAIANVAEPPFGVTAMVADRGRFDSAKGAKSQPSDSVEVLDVAGR